MAAQSIPVTIVNHVAQDIAAAPDIVWRAILEEYVEAVKFKELGYRIEQLDDDLSAVTGGYRMQLEQDGTIIDDRICRFTERDDVERRLSVFADYSSTPQGMVVYATYHAAATSEGTRYKIDCHATLGIPRPESSDRPAFGRQVEDLKTQFGTALSGYLEGLKEKLEGEHSVRSS